MWRLTDLWFRLRALFGRARMDREFTEEIEFHLEMETQELIQKGMSPREASRQAKLAFGGVERFRERAREARGTRPLEDRAQDLRFILRLIKRQPAFYALILLVFALGVGANTIIFSVVDGVVLRPLPYPDPDRLVVPWQTETPTSWSLSPACDRGSR